MVETKGRFLYREDLQAALPAGLTTDDSLLFADRYVRRWIEETLLYEKAKENIPDNAAIERQVENYRRTLILHTYRQALIHQKLADNVGEEEVEDALVCTMEQSGMTFTMRMDAKGDTVTNVEQETVVSTEGFTEDQIQQLRAAIEEAAAAYEAIEGTEYTTEEGDGEIREVITIPVADEEVLKAVIEQGLLPVDGDDVSEISLEQTRESLEASGWTVEE